MGFDKFPGTLQFLFPPFEFFINGDNGTLALFGGHDVVRFGVDGRTGEVFLASAYFAGEGIDLTQRVDLLAPHFDAVAIVLVSWVDLDHVAANAKGAAAQIFGAVVLNIDEAAQQGFARCVLAFFEHDKHAVIGFGRAETVDAGN